MSEEMTESHGGQSDATADRRPVGESMLDSVVSRVSGTDQQYWDDIDRAFALSPALGSLDSYFLNVDWLAHVLKTDGTTSAESVSRDERTFALEFLGVLASIPEDRIDASSLPKPVSERLKRLARVYGPIIDRAFDEIVRGHDWEYVDLSRFTPAGIASDRSATIQIVIRRFDRKELEVQTPGVGAARLMRSLLRDFANLDDEIISDADAEMFEDIEKLAQDIKGRILEYGNVKDGGEPPSG